ncbi:class I SAM-dependent methyltransferase [Thiohalorhabdus sp. Cl-TMA]|uniref:Class I SAM-dependent methyltransferase n=1 Tax=Thiohalorhabdus methylotrophus TaxID=3242694 RepID=A0ABV4TSP6_9GAMM
MAFDLKDIVPFGRSYREYVDMFALGESELAGHVLDCGGGPAAFNAELARRGGSVVSADPVYGFGREAIRARIDEVVPEMVAQLHRNRAKFRWDRSGSPEELVARRRAAMETFLADYAAGLEAGRYVEASLPELPFEPGRFDLALVSHLLFLYGDHLGRDFHIRALKELAGQAREVRVFPLADLNARRSPHLEPVRRALDRAGLASEAVKVSYESQKGVNRMLRIRAVEG